MRHSGKQTLKQHAMKGNAQPQRSSRTASHKAAVQIETQPPAVANKRYLPKPILSLNQPTRSLVWADFILPLTSLRFGPV